MGANGDTPKQNPFVAAINKALNLFASKKKDKKPEGQRNLNLQFSEGDVSDEENSEIINILDRKQYHERQAACAKSDPEMMQPSFFEKISTGSNTDSDLRVVRFDQNGMMIEPATTNCTSSIADFDEMPKFKQPIRSEQQHRM